MTSPFIASLYHVEKNCVKLLNFFIMLQNLGNKTHHNILPSANQRGGSDQRGGNSPTGGDGTRRSGYDSVYGRMSSYTGYDGSRVGQRGGVSRHQRSRVGKSRGGYNGGGFGDYSNAFLLDDLTAGGDRWDGATVWAHHGGSGAGSLDDSGWWGDHNGSASYGQNGEKGDEGLKFTNRLFQNEYSTEKYLRRSSL